MIKHSDGLITAPLMQLIDVPNLRCLGHEKVVATLCEVLGVPDITCLYVTGTDDASIAYVFKEDGATYH